MRALPACDGASEASKSSEHGSRSSCGESRRAIRHNIAQSCQAAPAPLPVFSPRGMGLAILALSDRPSYCVEENPWPSMISSSATPPSPRPSDVVKGDIGIVGGRVVALGERLDKGRKEIDATGPDRRAGRHRRPCPFRPGHRRRLGVLRRFRERQPGGGGRRHDHHHPLRLPEPRPVAARRGQPLSQARRGQVADRLCLPRDPVRSQREDHGPGFPGAGRPTATPRSRST